MNGDGFLIGVAQIGMVLAGFGGVVATFRHARRGWLVREIMALKFIFEHSFAVVFFSLAPFILLYAYLPDIVIWRIFSLFLACFLVFQIWITIYRTKRAPSRNPGLLRYTYFYPSLFFFEIEILNAILFGSLPIYLFGLLWLLVPPAVQFYLLIPSKKLPDIPPGS